MKNQKAGFRKPSHLPSHQIEMPLFFEVLVFPLISDFYHITELLLKLIAEKCPKYCEVLSFPGSSTGKEYACNAGEPSLITGLRSYPGEGICNPLKYSWASLMAQMVKNLPAMWETWLRSLGWEDSLEEDKATHSSILAWRIPMDREAWQAIVHGVAKSQTQLSD